MSINYEVEITAGGGDGSLVFYVTADPLNLNREQVMRPTRYLLAPNDVKDLRGGSPSSTLVMKIAKEMTEWLLATDIKNQLLGPVYNDKQPIRIIFKVDRSLLDTLSDLPVELLRIKNDWLALCPGVSAIVHQLPYTGLPKTPNQSLPLKVLVVRPSPSGLAVKVPPVAPVCNEIIKLATQLGPNVVQLDLLSREVGSLEPDKSWDEFEAVHLPELIIQPSDSPEEKLRKEMLKWREFREYLLNRKINELQPGTWERCQEYLGKTDYHILVYLGHGDHMDRYRTKVKVGVLQFEKPGGKNIEPVSASQLKEVLQNKSVSMPLVLLTGCLTAAESEALTDEQKQSLSETTFQWALGSQGVAQALVDSPSGVQCAVGMRYQIETSAGFIFLKTFFKSLLETVPGNVEAAVRTGRSKLFASGEFPPSWSAPVIFRTKGEEPMFRFIAEVPKTYTLDRDDMRDQDIREAMWSGLMEEPNSLFAYKQLDNTEGRIRAKAKDQGVALVMPDRHTASPGQTITVNINLHGNLSADLIQCKLTVSGAGASIESVHSTQQVKDRKYGLADISESGGSEIFFSIKRNAEANALPEGAIIQAKLTLGATVPAKYTVNLDVLKTEPAKVVRPVNNVVLVLLA